MKKNHETETDKQINEKVNKQNVDDNYKANGSRNKLMSSTSDLFNTNGATLSQQNSNRTLQETA